MTPPAIAANIPSLRPATTQTGLPRQVAMNNAPAMGIWLPPGSLLNGLESDPWDGFSDPQLEELVSWDGWLTKVDCLETGCLKLFSARALFSWIVFISSGWAETIFVLAGLGLIWSTVVEVSVVGMGKEDSCMWLVFRLDFSFTEGFLRDFTSFMSL